MQDPSKEFPSIRVLGTIGWIATGWMIDKVLNITTDQLALTFKMAAIASLVLGLWSFFLPPTPPKAKGTKATFAQILGADAFVLFKDRSFTIFFISSVLICIPLSFYYSFTNLFLTEAGMKNVTSNMTFGQFSEAFFILLIPFFFKRLGVKWMIALGMIAWGVRFVLFGYGDADASLWMLFAGIIMHGICFDFFFVTGQIYTDSKAGQKIQSQAQGMITMATYGIGMWIGTLLSGYVKDHYTVDNVVNWRSIWMVPAGISLVVLLLFILFFTDNKRSATHTEPVNMV
jgi:nucleoside transporter